MTGLRSGVLSYKHGEETDKFAVHYGYAEICQDKITVLAKMAEHCEEIDMERAKAAHDRAKTKLAQKLDDDDLIEILHAKLIRSLVRQRAAGG